MPRKHGSEANGYAELGRIGNDLAARYAKGEKKLAAELFENIKQFAFNFLADRVRGSRMSFSGVPGHMDEDDLLAQVQLRVFRKLDSGKYADEGKFKSMVLTIAGHVFLDALAWKKNAPKDGAKDVLDEDLSEAIAEPTGRAHNPTISLIEDNRADGRVPVDEVVDLIKKDLLNLILDGLRRVPDGMGASVFTARAFLGKGEAEICLIYDMKPDTVTSHFRRASLGVLEHVHTHPDFKDLSLEGLRTVLEMSFFLEEKDLLLLKEEAHRRVLHHASAGDLSLRELGKKMVMKPQEVLKTLRAAIVALSQAKVRRAKVAAIPAEGQEAWLWSQVGLMLASYPEVPARKRAAAPPTPGDGELAAFCQVAVYLGYSREDLPPPQTLSDLLGPRAIKDGVEATAKALGIKSQLLMGILSGEVTAEGIDSLLLSRLAAHFSLEGHVLLAAARATAGARPGLRTRALSPHDEARYFESVKRRVLGQRAKV